MATKESLTLRKAHAKERIIESAKVIESTGLKIAKLPDKTRDKDLEIARLLEYTSSVLEVASDEILRHNEIEKEIEKKVAKKGKK